jgi:hypothetical protein
VRQGYPLSAVLFNLYLDEVIRIWLQKLKLSKYFKDLIFNTLQKTGLLFVTEKTACKGQFIVCDTEDNLQEGSLLFVTQKTTCKRQFIVCDTEDNLQRAVYSL